MAPVVRVHHERFHLRAFSQQLRNDLLQAINHEVCRDLVRRHPEILLFRLGEKNTEGSVPLPASKVVSNAPESGIGLGAGFHDCLEVIKEFRPMVFGALAPAQVKVVLVVDPCRKVLLAFADVLTAPPQSWSWQKLGHPSQAS